MLTTRSRRISRRTQRRRRRRRRELVVRSLESHQAAGVDTLRVTRCHRLRLFIFTFFFFILVSLFLQDSRNSRRGLIASRTGEGWETLIIPGQSPLFNNSLVTITQTILYNPRIRIDQFQFSPSRSCYKNIFQFSIHQIYRAIFYELGWIKVIFQMLKFGYNFLLDFKIRLNLIQLNFF